MNAPIGASDYTGRQLDPGPRMSLQGHVPLAMAPCLGPLDGDLKPDRDSSQRAVSEPRVAHQYVLEGIGVGWLGQKRWAPRQRRYLYLDLALGPERAGTDRYYRETGAIDGYSQRAVVPDPNCLGLKCLDIETVRRLEKLWSRLGGVGASQEAQNDQYQSHQRDPATTVALRLARIDFGALLALDCGQAASPPMP